MGNRVSLETKQPAADYYCVVDMSPLLAAGEVVVTATVLVTLLLGDDPGCDLTVDGAATVSLNVVTQVLTNGLDGNTYCVRITASTNQGNALITLADLSVVDLLTE